MKKLALFALPLALASCTMVGPTDASYTLARQAVVTSTASAYAPAGTAKVTERLGVTRTSITLSGMAPYAIYVAHYHKQGAAAPAAAASTTTAATTTETAAAAPAATATTTDTAGAAPATNTAAQPAAVPAVNPCQSNGAPIMESKMVAQAGADGKVTLEGLVATALIQDATYLNVHTASDFNGTPADSGVVCTPVAIQ